MGQSGTVHREALAWIATAKNRCSIFLHCAIRAVRDGLSPFVQTIFENNNLIDGHYVEPYAGGAAVGLSLLLLEYASRIYINDISKPVYLFWKAVLDDTDGLCRKIKDKQVTPARMAATAEHPVPLSRPLPRVRRVRHVFPESDKPQRHHP